MTTLSLSPFSLLPWSVSQRDSRDHEVDQSTEADRRRVLNEMMAAGACDSEVGAQMLMAVYPDRF